jgi:hypothetical protein
MAPPMAALMRSSRWSAAVLPWSVVKMKEAATEAASLADQLIGDDERPESKSGDCKKNGGLVNAKHAPITIEARHGSQSKIPTHGARP